MNNDDNASDNTKPIAPPLQNAPTPTGGDVTDWSNSSQQSEFNTPNTPAAPSPPQTPVSAAEIPQTEPVAVEPQPVNRVLAVPQTEFNSPAEPVADQQTSNPQPFQQTPEVPVDKGFTQESGSVMPEDDPSGSNQFGSASTEPTNPQTTASAAPPLPTNIGSESITTKSRPKLGGFKLFMVAAVFLIIAIWGVVFYMYYKNNKSDSAQGTNTVPENVTVEPTANEVEKPTADQIKILNGSVVWSGKNGDVIIVSKNDYPQTGITGFYKAVLSPDQDKICFESWPPSPEPAVYLYDLKTFDVKEINPNRKNCLWKTDSKAVIYLNSTAETQSADIFSYDIASSSETNLTNAQNLDTVRRYEIVGLSSDGSRVVCKFEDVGTDQGKQDCEINLN